MKINFVPSCCKEVEVDGVKVAPSFSGSIVLRLPTLDEQYGYLEESGFTSDDDGDVKQSKALKGISAARKMAKIAQGHMEKIDLKRLSDGYQFNDYETLSRDTDGHKIILEVGGKILAGFKVGNG